MAFTIKDVLEELAYEEKAVFTVKLEELDNWIFSTIEKLRGKGIELLKTNRDVEVKEKPQSYQIILGARSFYFPKRYYNARTILKILQERLFTDILYQSPCFLRGLGFVFVRKEG